MLIKAYKYIFATNPSLAMTIQLSQHAQYIGHHFIMVSNGYVDTVSLTLFNIPFEQVDSCFA